MLRVKSTYDAARKKMISCWTLLRVRWTHSSFWSFSLTHTYTLYVLCRYDETIYNIMCNNRAAFYANGKQLQLKSPFELTICRIHPISIPFYMEYYDLVILAFYHDSSWNATFQKCWRPNFCVPLSCVAMHMQNVRMCNVCIQAWQHRWFWK